MLTLNVNMVSDFAKPERERKKDNETQTDSESDREEEKESDRERDTERDRDSILFNGPKRLGFNYVRTTWSKEITYNKIEA